MGRWAWLRAIVDRSESARTMGLDVRRDEHGGMTLRDTESNWRDFTGQMDREVSHEVDFRGPNELPFNRPSGMPAEQADWNLWWLDMIERCRKYRENPERHVAYVVRARRAAGLPELIRPDEEPS